MSEKDNLNQTKSDIEDIILEAVWIMRWNYNKTVLASVLTSDEAQKIQKDIIKELDNAGFEIVKKNE